MNWTEVIDAVAAALADRQTPAGGDPSRPQSLLAAVSGSIPLALQRRLQGERAAEGDVEPLIDQNDLPVSLLADGIIDVAAQAVGHWSRSQPQESPVHWDSAQGCPRVTAAVALAALSTLRLNLPDAAIALVQVRQASKVFREEGWTQALDSLARRTAELNKLLGQTVADRRQMTWQQVMLEDRILAEAVAAAVIGGAG